MESQRLVLCCFGHFSVAECAEVSVSSLQAELDSYICTETLPQADPTSVANVYSRS